MNIIKHVVNSTPHPLIKDGLEARTEPLSQLAPLDLRLDVALLVLVLMLGCAFR